MPEPKVPEGAKLSDDAIDEILPAYIPSENPYPWARPLADAATAHTLEWLLTQEGMIYTGLVAYEYGLETARAEALEAVKGLVEVVLEARRRGCFTTHYMAEAIDEALADHNKWVNK